MPSLTVTEKVIWTLCPQGFTDDGKGLKFSIFVSPRLTASGPGATLGNSDTTFADWPKALDNSKIAINLLAPAGTAVVREWHGDQLTWTSHHSSAVYGSIFPGSTPIADYRFTDLSKALLLSYPLAKMNGWFEGLYGSVGKQAHDGLPSPGDLISAGLPARQEHGPLSSRNQKGQVPRSQILHAIRNAPSLDALTQKPGDMLDLFSFFHKPLLAETEFTSNKPVAAENASWPGYKAPKMPSATEVANRTDFHRIAAAVSNYYALSRLCGLVLDVIIPADGLADGTLRFALQVKREKDGGDGFPVTRCVLQTAARNFQAAVANPARLNGRYLNVAQGGIDLIQMDVDGAAHKAIGLTASLPRMRATAQNVDDFSIDPQPEAGLPSLRTAGLTLAQSNRAALVQTKATRAALLNAAVEANHTPDDLTAEDLIRGYRVDITDVTRGAGPQSLCRRNVAYTFLKPVPDLGKKSGLGLNTIDSGVTWMPDREEEGTISLAAGSSPDGSVPDVYTLHEALFTWRGWSLSVPEPSQSLRNTPSVPGPYATKADEEKANTGPSDSEVPDGLPLTLDFKVAKGSLPSLRFGHVYQARVRTSDLTGGAAAYTDTSAPATWTQPAPFLRYEPLEAPAVALLAKVKTGIDETVVFDRVMSPPLQGEGMQRMALRTYDDPSAKGNRKTVWRNIAPPRVTQRFAEMHGVIDDDKGAPQPHWFRILATRDKAFAGCEMPSPDRLNPLAADPMAGETRTYTVSEQGFALPYLPDPYAIAIMARMKAIGQQDWTDVLIPLYPNVTSPTSKDWPNSAPILIEGDPKYTTFAHVNGVLQVPMPKACRQIVRLSSVMYRTALDNMALWQVLQKAGGKELQEFILKGRHWMFTPWCEIELIHATQRPLVKPVFHHFDVARDQNARDAKLTIWTPLSGASTARLDIDAHWSEPDDNPVAIDAKSAPVDRPHTAHVARLPIARLDGFKQDFQIDKRAHTFPDTRYRRVIYRMNALTRFKEFFEPEIRDDETKQNVLSDEAIQWIPSSAPPPAPSILYAIPTFGWQRDKTTAAASSRRRGGIRIYLDRPWLVSGYNEMLAVVLPASDDPEAGNDLAPNRPLVTQWGRDPITVSADITMNSPRPSAFRLALWKGPVPIPPGLPAIEGTDLPPGAFQTDRILLPAPLVPGQTQPGDPTTCTVAPHAVLFDPDRQLWYADIEVNLPRGSYFPFLRLAVARYQPVARPDAHLSPAVSCDFIQLTPDRIAVVVPLDGFGIRYNVLVYGTQPDDGRNAAQARRGRLLIQSQVLDADSDPILGWRDEYGSPLAGPKVSYTPDGADKAAQNAEAALQQSVQTANQVAAQLAAQGMAQNPPPASGTASAKPGMMTDRQANLAATTAGQGLIRQVVPNLIGSEIVNMPPAPAGGRRRILITETETYHVSAFTDDGYKGDAERTVYAEAIEV